MMALESEELHPFDEIRLGVFVAGAPGADRGRLLDILTGLRAAGVHADTDFMERGLKAQMKQADRLGARLVMIVGKDELQRGEVTLRDLDESKQWTVSLAGMVSQVRDFLESRANNE